MDSLYLRYIPLQQGRYIRVQFIIYAAQASS